MNTFLMILISFLVPVTLSAQSTSNNINMCEFTAIQCAQKCQASGASYSYSTSPCRCVCSPSQTSSHPINTGPTTSPTTPTVDPVQPIYHNYAACDSKCAAQNLQVQYYDASTCKCTEPVQEPAPIDPEELLDVCIEFIDDCCQALGICLE